MSCSLDFWTRVRVLQVSRRRWSRPWPWQRTSCCDSATVCEAAERCRYFGAAVRVVARCRLREFSAHQRRRQLRREPQRRVISTSPELSVSPISNEMRADLIMTRPLIMIAEVLLVLAGHSSSLFPSDHTVHPAFTPLLHPGEEHIGCHLLQYLTMSR